MSVISGVTSCETILNIFSYDYSMSKENKDSPPCNDLGDSAEVGV